MTLDALRGVAAFAIAALHFSAMWGMPLFSHAYLAVDFFFILSGFVIAAAYEKRLATNMSVGAFMLKRVIRLWPLLALGVVFVGSYEAVRAVAQGTSLTTLAGYALAGALMLPTPPSPDLSLYPLNFPTWSLLYELIINLAYAAVLVKLSTRGLAFVVAVSAGLLVLAGLHYGAMDLGVRLPGAPMALARVLFGFSAGVLAYRLHQKAFKVSSGLVLACLGVLAAILCLSQGPLLIDLAVAILAFPVLLIVAARIQPGPGFVGASVALGNASYALYVLHIGTARWLILVLHRLPFTVPLWVALPMFLGVALMLALYVDRAYDRPVREWLSGRRLGGPRTA